MSKYRYIKLDEKWLKKLRETAHFYSADIVCGVGTDWILKTAEAENKTLFEIISYLENAPSEDYVALHAAYTELTQTCMTLTQKVKVLNEQYDALLDRNVELTEENERLREDNEIKSQRRANMYEILDAHKRGRADAVREMVRIIVTKYAISKVHYADNEEPIITCELTNWQLDQITQEMLEGKCREQTLDPNKE